MTGSLLFFDRRLTHSVCVAECVGAPGTEVNGIPDELQHEYFCPLEHAEVTVSHPNERAHSGPSRSSAPAGSGSPGSIISNVWRRVQPGWWLVASSLSGNQLEWHLMHARGGVEGNKWHGKLMVDMASRCWRPPVKRRERVQMRRERAATGHHGRAT